LVTKKPQDNSTDIEPTSSNDTDESQEG